MEGPRALLMLLLLPAPEGDGEGEKDVRLYRGGVMYVGEEVTGLLLLLLLLPIVNSAAATPATGVRLVGDGEGGRPIRAR